MSVHGGVREAAALAIVAAIVFSAPAANALLPTAETADEAAGGRMGLGIGSLPARDDADEVLRSLEEAAECASCAPDWFMAELGMLPDARDVRVCGPVVGYVVDCGEDVAFGMLEGAMAARGWQGVPLGGVTGATFVKDEGACTWALVTCTQVGAATCVVSRCYVA